MNRLQTVAVAVILIADWWLEQEKWEEDEERVLQSERADRHRRKSNRSIKARSSKSVKNKSRCVAKIIQYIDGKFGEWLASSTHEPVANNVCALGFKDATESEYRNNRRNVLRVPEPRDGETTMAWVHRISEIVRIGPGVREARVVVEYKV